MVSTRQAPVQFASSQTCQLLPGAFEGREHAVGHVATPEDHVAVHHAARALRGVGRVLEGDEGRELARLVVLLGGLFLAAPGARDRSDTGFAVFAAQAHEALGRDPGDSSEDVLEGLDVVRPDALAYLAPIARQLVVGAQLVLAQGFGVIRHRGEVEQRHDAPLAPDGQVHLRSSRELVRRERVVVLVAEDVGVERIRGMKVQLAEIGLSLRGRADALAERGGGEGQREGQAEKSAPCPHRILPPEGMVGHGREVTEAPTGRA